MRMFNITPKPRMLLAVQNQKWTVSGALAELIDNAFGPGRGNATAVKITLDVTNRTLTVTDDGQGMEYIGRLFQLGNTIGRFAGDIGHYGSGGTQAIIWLPEWVTVATERNGKIMQDTIRWSDIFAMEDFRDIAVTNEWKNGRISEYSEWTHGTAIHMKLLKTRKISVSNVLRDLSRLFAPGLRRGKKIIWCQRRAGELIDVNFLNDPFEIRGRPENTVHFDIVMERGKEHLPVHGAISFDGAVSHAESLVRIGLGYREIMRTRECFKSGNEAFAGIGVSGWLDLGDGWQKYLSTTKDGFDDQPLFDKLMDHVFANIRNLLILAEQQTVDFELENIAVGPQIAFEKTMQIKVSVVRDKSGPNPDSGSGSGANSGSGEKETPDLDSNKDKPATAHIRLVKQNDDNMMGALARAGSDPIGMYVDINRDHAYVREAMKQRPVNSAALNLLIITEIATLLSADPILARKAFKKTVIDELDRRNDGDKTRMLVRHLIDSVPNKHRTAEAPSPTWDTLEERDMDLGDRIDRLIGDYRE